MTTNKSLTIVSLIALFAAIGIIGMQENVYASGQDPFISCEIEGEWERGEGFWTEGTCEGDLIGDRVGEFEVEVEVHGEFEVGDQTEGRCKEVSTELTIYSGNGEEDLEGTITATAEGEICREGRDTTTTWQELEITGGTGDFSTIIGSFEGSFHSEMEREEGDFEATIHAYLIIAEHGQVVEVHCDVEYEFEMIFIFGEREGYGECVYIFADGFEQHEEVSVSGEFIVGSLVEGFRTIDGSFHIEDYEDNAIWLDEEGSIEIDCDIETEEEEEFETPYCLETEVIVEGGDGIFSFLDGEGTRTAQGYFTTEFIFTEGYAYSTIWIFFDCPECEPEEEEPTPEEETTGKGGCSNCEPPTLGLNKSGDRRMVDGGFTCNRQTVDVEHYYTNFPLITNAVGQALQCTFIIYEDTHADNVRHFEFAVGKRAGDSMSEEQGKIVWEQDFKGVETVYYDNYMFRNVYVLSSLTKCLDTSNTATCLKLELSATPKMPLVEDIIVKTNVWDERRNAKQNFYNDGIDFVGNSENPLPSFNVVDGRNGITQIYTTDPTLENLDTAIDKYGNTWTLTNNIWQKDYISPNMSCNVSSYIGYDRTCPEFALMVQGQALIGTQYFNSSAIQSEPSEPFAYEYPESLDRLEGTQLG